MDCFLFCIEVFLGLFSKMWGFVFVCSGVRKIEVRAFGILVACFSMELGILSSLEVFYWLGFF